MVIARYLDAVKDHLYYKIQDLPFKYLTLYDIKYLYGYRDFKF